MAAKVRAYVKVGDGQDIDQALREFRKRVQQEYGRPWCKRRYGYYESKGTLGRKRKKMKALRGGGPAFFQPHSLKLHVWFRELFENTGPQMAAGGHSTRPETRHRPCRKKSTDDGTAERELTKAGLTLAEASQIIRSLRKEYRMPTSGKKSSKLARLEQLLREHGIDPTELTFDDLV